MHVAAMAAKPRTTMTAIAQRGKGAPAAACCTEPDPVVGEEPEVRDAEAAEEADARDEEEAAAAAEEAEAAADADDAEAEDDDDAAAAEEEATESRTAVCTAVKVAWGTAFPSSGVSLRVMTQ